MKESTTSAAVVPVAIVEEAWQEVGASFERFCLTAGIATLANMMEEDERGTLELAGYFPLVGTELVDDAAVEVAHVLSLLSTCAR